MADTDFFIDIDRFINVQPGEPFRLLPFGTLVKNGKRREVTPDMARRFKLPHFQPAIKLGSHDDTTKAGGHIVGLEVRADGLYAIPEFNDQGAAAIANGDYRYHSPEILWEGALEDPTTGAAITGPLIVGDALLHTPHLGAAAALYTMERRIMNDEQVTMPAPLFERFMAFFKTDPPAQPAPVEPQVAAVDVEKYAAIQAERDDLAAKVATMETQARRGERVQKYAAELDGTTLNEDAELHELLADLEDDKAAAIVQRVKAISEQARVAALTEDVGATGNDATGDPTANLDAAIRQRMAKTGENYGAALMGVGKDNPDLIAAYGRN